MDRWSPRYWARIFATHVTILTLLTTALSEGDLGRSRRVIGGTEVSQDQWPFLVSLHGHIPSSNWWVFVTSYVEYWCGGTLINKRWILTAAHCFESANPVKDLNSPRKWRVKAGDVNRRPGSLLNVIKLALGADVSGDSGQWWYVRVSKIIIHPLYELADTYSWRNDLALVELLHDLPMALENPRIALAKLPLSFNDTWPPPGTNCSLQGWGCTAQGGPLQDVARMINVPILSAEECENSYGDLEDNRICAGYINGGKGICKGDSGGPLVCLSDNTWTLAGIISYTSLDSPENHPGVFTRVTKFLPWILNITSTN